MRQDQLHQIIVEKNVERERQVLRTAEDIIEQIVTGQQAINGLSKHIVELREELKQLQVQQLDAISILGE